MATEGSWRTPVNPWAFLIILIGILLVIIGVKGTQHNIAAAITGHGSGNANAGIPGAGTPAQGGGGSSAKKHPLP